LIHASLDAHMVELNPTDQEIIEMLGEGRCTPSHIAKKSGYSRQNINNRLKRLVELGYVEKVDKGLYEMKEKPEDG